MATMNKNTGLFSTEEVDLEVIEKETKHMFNSHQNAEQIYNTDSQGLIKFGIDALETRLL
jgi:hypothetical protein